MYDFEYIANMLDDIVDNMPDEILKELNGIFLVDQIKHNPKIPSENYYVMGEFCNSNLGHSIDLYYGSIIRIYGHLPPDELKIRLKEIVKHELRHHLETLAGCDDLVRLDNIYVQNALKKLNDG